MATPDPLAILRAALPADLRIDGFLSRGGQGHVFGGACAGEPAAIKIFDPSGDPRRIERELAALRAIDCEYLVKVRADATITLNGQQVRVVAYEFLEGGDLTAMSAAVQRPTFDELREVARHVGTAVEALWASRIVHRDIKPANVMRSRGRYVLVDIGLARHVDMPSLTALGGSPGTAGYKSPEQAAGRRNLTISSDVFSLGVTLYLLSAGVHPFGGNQANIGVINPERLEARRPDLPPAFCRLVDTMMSPATYNRPTLSDIIGQL